MTTKVIEQFGKQFMYSRVRKMADGTMVLMDIKSSDQKPASKEQLMMYLRRGYGHLLPSGNFPMKRFGVSETDSYIEYAWLLRQMVEESGHWLDSGQVPDAPGTYFTHDPGSVVEITTVDQAQLDSWLLNPYTDRRWFSKPIIFPDPPTRNSK